MKSSLNKRLICALNPFTIQERVYAQLIKSFLRFYENWVLPPGSRESLLSLKRREFKDRLTYINPYTRNQIEINNKDLADFMNRKNLGSITPYQMHNFTITYDRHFNKYGPKLKDFPESYNIEESVLNYMKDPLWYYKFKPSPLRLKRYFFIAFILYYLLQKRVKYIERVDAEWRTEQRKMQNQEISELPDTPVNFIFKNANGEAVNSRDLKGQFVILWYDTKLQLFGYLKDELPKKRIAYDKIGLYLVVNSDEAKERLEKRVMDYNNKKEGDKSIIEIEILVYKEEDNIGFSIKKAEEDIEGEEAEYSLKQDYFYIIDPESKLIDCAKIYSFGHESNILKRICAKINKNVDENLRYT